MQNITTRRTRLSTTWPDVQDAELIPVDERQAAPLAPSPLVRINLPAPRSDDDAAPLTETERRIPTRAPSVESDVAVPGLQASITAFAALLCVGLAAWAFGWNWRAVAVAVGVAFAGAWLIRLRVADGSMYAVEHWTGYAGRTVQTTAAAQHAPIVVNAHQARQEVAQTVQASETSAERAELVQFVHKCFVAGTSEKAHGVTRGSGTVRDDYIRRRDVLLSLGIAQWKNAAHPSAGWRVAVSHERALQLLAKHVM